MGSPRHLYYERSDGSNLIKLDSASATLTYSSTSGTTEFNFNAQTSNLSYDIPSTSSDRERIGVRFEASNDLERQRGYGGHLGYENISTYKGSSGDLYSFDSETGAVNLKIYFNPNLRSGNHKYRVMVNDRVRGNRSVYTYIYWSELVAMGIVTQDRIAYTNGSGTSDIDGPKIGTVSSQIKDSPPTCTFTPDNAYPNNTSGYVVMTDTKTGLSITDESLASNLAIEDYGNEASVYLRYENYDAAGNLIDTLRHTSGTESVSGTTKNRFWAPIDTIDTAIGLNSIDDSGHAVKNLTAVSRSLSGAPYITGSTYEISTKITFEPSFINFSEIALPIPPPAPVTNETFPESGFSAGCLLSLASSSNQYSILNASCLDREV